MPSFGAPAVVEVFEEFAPGLLRLHKHSHFWVLAWLMERPERDVLQVTPRGVSPGAPDALHGVFAVRSPARPNPIGLTAARLERADGRMLAFDRLDFVNGTAVLDLKPYFASRDLIFSAINRQIGRPSDRAALRESLLFQAQHWSAEQHADAALAIRILEHFRSEVLAFHEPEEWSVGAPARRPYLMDAMAGLTRVSFGSGLEPIAEDAVVLNKAATYEILHAATGFLETLEAPDSQLFAYRPHT